MGNPCHLLGWAHLTFSRNLTRYVRHFYRFALSFLSQSRTVASAASLACMLVCWLLALWLVLASNVVSISPVRRQEAWPSCLRRSEIKIQTSRSTLSRLLLLSSYLYSIYTYSTNTIHGFFVIHSLGLENPFSAQVRASLLGVPLLPGEFTLPIHVLHVVPVPLASNLLPRPRRSVGG